jgi:hypothetical protein
VFHEVSRETCTTVFLVEVRKIPLKDEIGRLEDEDEDDYPREKGVRTH